MADSQFYSDEDLAKLNKSFSGVMPSWAIVADYLVVHLEAEENAREYITHGVLRRLVMMRRCIERIYELCPPDTRKLDDPDIALDITIYLQSFYIHMYGAFENLARVSIEMSGIEISESEKRQASFLSKKVNSKIKKILPEPLRKYFSTEGMSSWCRHLNNFRHSLAHRIPLYIPENVLSPNKLETYQQLEKEKENLWENRDNCRRYLHEDIQKKLKELSKHRKRIHAIELEQSNLMSFSPVALHSYNEEGSHIVVFHAQILANWNTMLDFICLFLNEMQPPLGQQLREDLIAKDVVTFESE
ncbi:hypothetical protein [Maridesulfovibrio salexigens]|uniref:Cthe-2314-like HEPN domain-containing protein n=1 Tax=Maridesulfovibrio salexigens (strain ATCC 14822 / DSM 2638 / NCIMB 8403 / VKM B-1763) TaxID=526222 RepID=C6BRN7_MARSD|nr:hypothetical protein [Maridesulfovibrio salexigens]ACS79477.1 hypothetical protein Desal_1415 [Maridesulfovibrio salexigens DSM 2638]